MRPNRLLYRDFPPELRHTYGDAVRAHDCAHFVGLVAADQHPNPVPHADVVTTTIHKTLCGPRSGMILCREEHAKAIDKAIFPGQQGGPLMHTIAAKAVALRISASNQFKIRQKQTIASALGELGSTHPYILVRK